MASLQVETFKCSFYQSWERASSGGVKSDSMPLFFLEGHTGSSRHFNIAGDYVATGSSFDLSLEGSFHSTSCPKGETFLQEEQVCLDGVAWWLVFKIVACGISMAFYFGFCSDLDCDSCLAPIPMWSRARTGNCRWNLCCHKRFGQSSTWRRPWKWWPQLYSQNVFSFEIALDSSWHFWKIKWWATFFWSATWRVKRRRSTKKLCWKPRRKLGRLPSPTNGTRPFVPLLALVVDSLPWRAIWWSLQLCFISRWPRRILWRCWSKRFVGHLQQWCQPWRARMEDRGLHRMPMPWSLHHPVLKDWWQLQIEQRPHLHLPEIFRPWRVESWRAWRIRRKGFKSSSSRWWQACSRCPRRRRQHQALGQWQLRQELAPQRKTWSCSSRGWKSWATRRSSGSMQSTTRSGRQSGLQITEPSMLRETPWIGETCCEGWDWLFGGVEDQAWCSTDDLTGLG